jgi:pyruvate dehydrogenase E2 component (dihydrolipoamide acetyltransferase)
MADAFNVTPLSPIRRVIAARMAEANRTTPHFRIVNDVEVDELVKLRVELREQHKQQPVSLNDLFIKACATALMDEPAVNIQLVENEIRQYRAADISVVVALREGLSTPIIRSADSKAVWEISREVRALALRAASQSLKIDEVIGGSFSISNMGMHGVTQFDAIINPPQCAILAVGATRPQVVVTKRGETRVATLARITLSVDHRVIDGVMAAKFMASLRDRLERPEYMREHKVLA